MDVLRRFMYNVHISVHIWTYARIIIRIQCTLGQYANVHGLNTDIIVFRLNYVRRTYIRTYRDIYTKLVACTMHAYNERECTRYVCANKGVKNE